MIEAQQLRQSPGVNLVALVALSHGLGFPRIAHHHSRDVWFQKVVEPGRRSPFFKGDVQIPAQPAINCRIMLAFVSMRLSITIFPAAFLTAIEMLSLCTSIAMYLLLFIEGAPF